MRDVCIDLFAASVGGGCGIIIGQPVDVIKVRLQVARKRLDIISASRSIYANGGVRGFFAGMAAPLVGQGGYSAMSFAGYNACMKFLSRHADSSRKIENMFLSGCSGGALSTLVTTPCEFVKIHRQTSPMRNESIFSFVRSIVQQSGIRGLYSGWTITLIRDAPSSGLYFLIYHKTKEMLKDRLGHTGAELISGGTAGVLSWATVIPIDIIKTRIQDDSSHNQRRYSGIIDCARKIYAKEGLSAFTKGGGPLLMRAFPASAVTFVVYERVVELLQ